MVEALRPVSAKVVTFAPNVAMRLNAVLLFNDLGELIRARLAADGYHEISRVALIEPTYPFGGRKATFADRSPARHKIDN